MATAHHVGGPLHGKVSEFGPGDCDYPEGYYLCSYTKGIGPWESMDALILYHGRTLQTLPERQAAVAAHWAEFERRTLHA